LPHSAACCASCGFTNADAILLHLDTGAVNNATSQIILTVYLTQVSAPCPLWAILARRIHSYYERTFADLSWAHYHVRVRLRVRQWCCRNRHCHRSLHEPLPTVATPGRGTRQ